MRVGLMSFCVTYIVNNSSFWSTAKGVFTSCVCLGKRIGKKNARVCMEF